MSDSPFVALPDPNHGKSTGRYRRMAKSTIAGLIGKGTTLLVGLVIVPITVRYLGPERYGIWTAISSSILMFFLLDIGIANTLTNLISETYAASDNTLAAKYFATAFWMVSGVSVAIGVSLRLLWPHIQWQTLFHISGGSLVQETSRAFAAAVIVLLFALPTSLISRVLAGYQELHVANLFAAGGNLLSLLAVVVIVRLHGSLAALVAGYAGVTVLANVACLFWVCTVSKPWLKPSIMKIDRKTVTRLFHTGGQFFVLQISGLVVFNSDNIIIAHYLNPSMVTQYSVTWRLAGLIAAIQSLVIPSLWPAYAEAWARGDIEWIRTAYGRMRWVTLTAVALACAVLLPTGRSIIRIWAGPGAVPTAGLLELMCVWMVLYSITMNQACLMGATYHVSTQAISSGMAAISNLALSVLWVRRYGPLGVLLATVVSYIAFILVVQVREVRTILRTNPGRGQT